MTHNSVSVDGLEQNTFNPQWLFKMDQEGEARFTLADEDEDGCGIAAYHTAYDRLDPPVRHERRLFLSADGSAVIDDTFDDATGHTLRWYFLLHPTVTPRLQEGNVVLMAPSGKEFTIVGDTGFQWALTDGFYSSGYGFRKATKALVAERSDAPSGTTIIFSAGNAVRFEPLKAAADQWWDRRPGTGS